MSFAAAVTYMERLRVSDLPRFAEEETRTGYGVALYSLRKALDALDGVFTYGCGTLVMIPEDYGSEIGTRVDWNVMASIRKEPEDWMVVTLYYK